MMSARGSAQKRLDQGGAFRRPVRHLRRHGSNLLRGRRAPLYSPNQRRRDHFLLACNAATPDSELDTACLHAMAGRLAGGPIVLGSGLGGCIAILPPGVPASLFIWEHVDAYRLKPFVAVDFQAAGHRVRFGGACDALGAKDIAVPSTFHSSIS